MRFNAHNKYQKIKADPFSQASTYAKWFRIINDDDIQ